MGNWGRGASRRALLALTTALCSGLAAPALARSVHPNLDANGVDLTDGTFNPQLPIYSIGSGQAELALVATPIPGLNHLDNWNNIQLSQSTYGGVITVLVTVGTYSDTFTSADGFAASTRGTGATLVHDGSSAVYRTLDGVTISFSNPNPAAFGGGSSNFCNDTTTANCYLLPSTIEGKAGLAVNYDWDVTLNCVSATVPDTDSACNEYWRLHTVSNDAGYSIGWTYVNPTGSPVPAYFRPATVTFGNANKSGTSPVVTYGYPASEAMTITTPGGKTWRITSAAGPITGIRRPSAASDTTTISYSSGYVSSVTSDGITTNYNRSVSGSTATMVVTNALSNTTTIVSDLNKVRPVSVADALGRTTTMSYDSVGKLTEVSYPEGDKKQFGYDAASRTTSVTLKAKPGSGLADIVTSTSFGSACPDATCPAWSKDALGNQTDYTYDGATGLIATATAPAATSGATRAETRYSYTTVAGVAVVTGVSTCRSGSASSCVGTANETKQTISYDANLNATSATVAAGDASLSSTVSRTYDLVGNLLTVDGPLSGSDDTMTYRWSTDREQLGVIAPDPDGSGSLPRPAVKATYNADGQPTVIERGTVTGTSDTDWAAFGSAQQATTTYDANARAVKRALTAGGTTYKMAQKTYDAVGRVECSATRMNPSVFSALPSSACSLGTTGSYGPDRIVKATYDAAGQQTKVTTAYGTADQSDDAIATYTNNGSVATATDAEGNRTSYTYDGFDRVAKVTLPSTTKGAGTSNSGDYEQYAYDANGAVTSWRLRDGRVLGFGYDALNRVIVKTVPDGSGLAPGATRDVYYGYDLLGGLTNASFDSLTGEGVSASYDALGRQTATTTTMGGTSRTLGFQWDQHGNRTRVTHPDGNFVSYTYDLLDRPTIVSRNGTNGLITYAYDAQGSLVQAGTGYSTFLDRDPLGRLSALRHYPANSSYHVITGLSYNPADQIVQQSRDNDLLAYTGHANANRTYAANGLNQYTSAGSATLGYDANGNLTGDGTTTYGYDVENRLVAASNGASLSYDPLGRLDTVTKAGATTRFVHDGDRLTLEYDGSGNLLRRYAHGTGADDPVAWFEGAAMTDASTRLLRTDPQGSVTMVANASTSTVSVNAYDESGIPAAANTGRFQYTGQAWLAELGLYYYKARMYAPTLGRFLQTDPIGYADGMNWYNYVGSDPVNKVDPSGLAGDCSGDHPENCEVVVTAAIKVVSTPHYAPTGGANFSSYGALPFALAGIGDLLAGLGEEPQNEKVACKQRVRFANSLLSWANGADANGDMAIKAGAVAAGGALLATATGVGAPGGGLLGTFALGSFTAGTLAKGGASLVRLAGHTVGALATGNRRAFQNAFMNGVLAGATSGRGGPAGSMAEGAMGDAAKQPVPNSYSCPR